MTSTRSDAELRFRLAAEADVDSILAMMSEYYAGEGYPFDPAASRDAVARLIREPAAGRLWIVEDARAPVGYVALTLGYSLEYLGRDAFLDELYVRESHRGRGIATGAMDLVESTCRALSIRALHLEVERDNPARSLYDRRGFVDHDRFLMTKRL